MNGTMGAKRNQSFAKRNSYPKLCLICKKLSSSSPSKVACIHCKQVGCPQLKVVGRSLCKRHLREDSRISTKSCREQSRRDQLGGIITKQTPPVIYWWADKGNTWKKEASIFLNTMGNEVGTLENYMPTDLDPGKAYMAGLPPHRYKNLQFYDRTLLEGSNGLKPMKKPPTTIRNLTDREKGSALEKCVAFGSGEFLGKVAFETLCTIRTRKHFVGAARMAAVDSDRSVDPFHYTFGAAALHIQEEDDCGTGCNQTSAYYPHVDKFGSVVLFLQLDGLSFTFVALPGNGPGGARFEQGNDHWARYIQWRAHASMDESKALKHFEEDFLKKATQRNQTTVKVFELLAGQRLCFAAGLYLHASIIPAQVRGTKRSLLLFHDLAPF
jgi:hypothetical protein